MKHWYYLTYLLKHKWFVFVAGRKVRAPVWRLLVHDWSKFLPSEWGAYADHFYGEPQVGEHIVATVDGAGFDGIVVARRPDQPCPRRGRAHWCHMYYVRGADGFEWWVLPGEVEYRSAAQTAFKRAWQLHVRRNAHHWEHWLTPEPRPMPDPIVREMVADWLGAQRSIQGNWDVHTWYRTNEQRIVLHPRTLERVNQLLGAL